MLVSPVAQPTVAADQLLRAVAAATAELQRLAGERVSLVGNLAHHWAGGHRLRYDAALLAVEREARRLLELLLQIAAACQSARGIA